MSAQRADETLDIRIDRASEPPTPPSVPRPMTEQVLGRYRLSREIAHGGMATVYLAVAEGAAGFEKAFALKRIHPHLAHEKAFVEMFLDEARIASRIDHPNVCGVLDFGEQDGSYWLAMEYLMGQPLSSLRRRLETYRASDPARLSLLGARIIADACEGLHAAHETRDADGCPLEIVHRDVSPHNLFVTWDGVVKVVDFGIARAANRVHHTGTGMVKGKFAYMAPEQMRGAPVDRRADVWSLGVLLWESVAGRPLFRRASDAETVLAVTRTRAPSLADARPGTCAELAAIAARALEPDPEQRFDTAREMGRALQRWIAQQDEPMGAAEVAEQMVRAFPDGAERQRAVLRRALAERSGTRQVHRVESGEDPSRSAVVRRSEPPPRRRWPLVAAVAVVLLATGLGGGLVTYGEDASAEQAQGEAPSAATAAEPGAAAGGGAAPQEPPAAAPSPPAAEPSLPAAEPELGEGAEPESGEGAEPELGEDEDGEPSGDGAEKPPARPRGRGVVNVAVRGGWAEVYVRGRRLGPTPGRFTLPAGRHVLTLRSGERQHRVAVRIRRGKVTRLTVEMPR